MTLPIRVAWPGRSDRSRDRPLRLLSSPSTATRSAIGVVPGGSSVADGRTGSAAGWAWLASLPASGPPQAPSRTRAAAAVRRIGRMDNLWVTQSGVQAW